MRATFCSLAATVLVVALGACGGSSDENSSSTPTAQEQAQITVCVARESIGMEVDKLKGMTASTVTTNAVTQSLGAIKNDLKDMSSAQSQLRGDRRSEAEAANQAFSKSVQGITSQLLTSLSASDAKAALATALDQLGTSYKDAFAPLKCD
jgi:hypothetical protein